MRRPGRGLDHDRPRSPPPAGRALDRRFPLLLGLVAYVPPLLTHRGMVGADTKQYLYLDPGRLLAQAGTMWDPNTGMGTVTHQNIGYLWPMGPWYWLFSVAGVPVWVAQRLWIGTLLLAAGLGVRWLLQTLGWQGPGLAVASLAYMLSPYVIQYEARISAILMPWAALPWLLALAIRSLRRGGWRHPALFALVAATVGSVNATGLIYAGLAPVGWFPFAVWGLGTTTVRRAAAAMARIGGLTLLLSLWWIAGILVEGRYGLNILRYTETVEVVARTGLPFEVLRGLGNWFLYGRDSVAPWVQPAVDYTQWGWLLAVSFALPALAVAAAMMIRWRYKLYFALLVVVGVALAVGVHPYAHPSPAGAVFKAFATGSTVGLALRSTGRAVPLIALGTSVLLGAGLDALWRSQHSSGLAERDRRRRAAVSRVAVALVVVLVVADMAPLWLGQFVDNNLQRPSALPSYWPAAANWLSGQDRTSAGGYSTRVLELPGADFSHYQWGTTLDPVTPGLTDRPVIGRQLQPSGSPASADLLRALDRQLQEGVLDPSAIAPVARLMGVGDVLLRSDLQYERFRTPRPKATWQLFDPAPPGLQLAATFGPPVADHPVIPYTDEITLADLGAPAPPAVAVFGVQGARSIIRTEPSVDPILLAGDGEGVVDSASSGLIDSSQAVLYAADVEQNPALLARVLAAGADLVLTDTNRRRAQRWGSLREVYGYTEQAGEKPLVTDTNDARLPLFPGAGDNAYTVSQQRGGASVQATGYGDIASYATADRPDQAMDGNLDTAWTVGAAGEAIGQRLAIDLAHPTTTGQVTLAQPLTPVSPRPPGSPRGPRYRPPLPTTRVITEVTLTFDGGHPITETLGPSSLQPSGQKVTFPARTFHHLEIRIDDTSTHRQDHRHDNGVGFAEVEIGPPAQAPRINEVIRLPTDLLADAAGSANQHRLFVVLTRARSNPAEPFKPDEEPSMARTFTLPAGRTFALTGTARVSALAPDQIVDRLLGRPDPPIPNSSGRLPGDLAAGSSAAFDGNPATWWSPARGPQEGTWISAELRYPVVLDRWTMQVVADGLHSVPTRLRIQVDGQPDRLVTLPPIRDGNRPGATVSVPIDLGSPVTARSRVTVVIDAVRRVATLDSLSELPVTSPVGIAELGLPGVAVPPAATTVPQDCRTDLLSIDGRPVGLRLEGTTQSAAQRGGLAVQPCGPDSGGIALGPGPHEVRTQPGRISGIDLDQLVLGSEKGGGPLAAGPGGPAPATVAAAPVASRAPAAVTAAPVASSGGAPPVTLTAQGRTTARLRIGPSSSATPFWLVLGQSLNAGWQARITGPGGASLGSPRLIDGYANGWLIQPRPGQPIDVALSWAPQQPVDAALVLSALGALLCVGLAVPSPRFPGLGTRPELRPGRLPDRPTALPPWRSYDPPLPVRRAAVVVAGSGVVAALLIGWVAGLVVAAVVALGCRPGRWQALPGAVAAGAVVASGLYVTQSQVAHHYRLVLEWPQHFEAVAGVAWVAVALVGADATIRHLRGRRSGQGAHRSVDER